MSSCIAIFAKYPMRGRVKTRLSPPLTPDQATELYRAFLLDTLHLIAHIDGVTPAILYTPDEAHDDFRALAPQHFALLPQRGAGFGERLACGFADLFAQGYASAAIMDADSPTLPRAHIVDLFARLAAPRAQISIGPCEDGGYWAIGMTRLFREVLTDISWSTERVLHESLARAREAGLRASLAPAWYDVDDAHSLERLRAELSFNGAARAQQTHAALARLYPPSLVPVELMPSQASSE